MEICDYSSDDDLIAATRADGRTRVGVARPARLQVVLGRGSDADRELHVDACERDGVELLRRHGGGCAVVLDPGCVLVSVCLRAPGIGENRKLFERINAGLTGALARLGAADLSMAGISDLARDDRKVAGTSLYRSKDTAYYAASLLVEPPVAAMERYLRHPPREPDYRRGRGHAQFVGALADVLGGRDAAWLADHLPCELDGSFSF